MTAPTERRSPEAQAEQLCQSILKAAHGWAREAPPALQPSVRAVTIRLGEMVADQRNFFAPLPGPQEAERAQILALVAKRLEDGEFRWPKIEDGTLQLTSAQLQALLEGLDWRRVHEAQRTTTPVAAS